MSDKWETVGKSPNAKKKAKAMPKIEVIALILVLNEDAIQIITVKARAP
jgi:hypothetical protein